MIAFMDFIAEREKAPHNRIKEFSCCICVCRLQNPSGSKTVTHPVAQCATKSLISFVVDTTAGSVVKFFVAIA
jgi:hypothetical protein